ncbi:MAG: T9SS type A sorting domain-containing protein [Rhodothermaceae bacterium]|nr:T9SS type A sorting domain-containing protein [Rhodothermaceae bacterium]
MQKLLALALILLCPALATAQTVITDADIAAGETVVLTADNEYLLDGMVFVDSAATLIIEPGTVIKAENGQGNDATGLVVTRYGQIFAEGTAQNPIIMTSKFDPLDGSVSFEDRGLWGGVVILGQASTNNQTEDGLKEVEGVNEIVGEGDNRAQYGGENDTHSSGVFRYVSIRHSGINVGDQAGNEIQGLTLGGVGSGTVIEYVESYASADDGFEFFGGTVNTKYLVSAFNEDDSFDWDEGFRGKGQFWFAIQADDAAGRTAEQDGATGNEFFEPFAAPYLANVTYIGPNAGTAAGDGAEMLIFRDNSGGVYRNSIFTEYNSASGTNGILVEVVEGNADKPADSEDRMAEGDLVLSNNLWWGFGDNSIGAIASQDFVQTHLLDNGNWIADPMLRGISRSEDSNGLDPRPSTMSSAWDASQLATLEDDFFTPVHYAGAFGTNNWLLGWTALDEHGVLAPAEVGGGDMITVTDADIAEGATVVWTADNEYLLDGMVFVDSAATLIIEPGTVIKAENGQGNEASGLVVTRHAKILAEGTAQNPIVFTSKFDPLDGSVSFEDRGLWGGVVVLGQASTNNQTEDGLKEVEGVNEIVGEGDNRAQYGGENDTHSSGVFRYVSIRHSGINVGDQAGNEIQGLTLGGVGSGTVIEFVESYASGDDGFEFFGGTVNTKYLVSAFNEDDSFDWDEGFRGKGQFWFAIQADDAAGRTAEQDGATGNEFFEPFATPYLANVTYIGPNAGTAAGDGAEMLIFRDNSGGVYRNSIFTEYNSASGTNGILVEVVDGNADKPADSEDRLAEGDLVLSNNLWWGFGDNSIEAIASQDFVQTHLLDNGNWIADPMLRGISRAEDSNGLDPRPSTMSSAWDASQLATLEDPFFTPVSYAGAFGLDNWLAGWTALEEHNVLAPVVTGTDIETISDEVPGSFALQQNYPNPFNPTTTIEFQLNAVQDVQLVVYDVLGREVARLTEGVQPAGTYSVDFDASGLSSGMYFYQLKGENISVTKTMLLLK